MLNKNESIKLNALSDKINQVFKLFPIFVIFFVSNSLAFAFTAKHPQCCDTEWYQTELARIVELGFFPTGNVSWLSSEHNYFYATFLYVLSKVGLHGRFGVTVAQFMLLTTILTLALIYVNRRFKRLRIQYSLLITGLGIFLNLNFTAYGLTEGLAASLLVTFSWIFLMFYKNSTNNRWYVFQVIGLLAISNVLWMLRPSFVWIMMFTVLAVSGRALLAQANRIKFFARELFLAISIAVIITIPQLFIIKQRSFLDSLFHLRDIKANAVFENSVLRYTTNISECGPRQLLFSPYAQDVEGIYPSHYLESTLPRIASFIARLVSGWDGLPSSLTYLSNFSMFPGLVITLISGFIFVSSFFLINEIRRDHEKWSISLNDLLLPGLFFCSQIAIGVTHGEFRYNIAGWVIGLANLLVLISRMNRKIVRGYLGSSVLCSFVFLVIGQLTLLFSSAYQTCIR